MMRDRKPEEIAEQVKCNIWRSCVYGACCALSSFDSDNTKMPLMAIVDGVPICQDVKRD